MKFIVVMPIIAGASMILYCIWNALWYIRYRMTRSREAAARIVQARGATAMHDAIVFLIKTSYRGLIYGLVLMISVISSGILGFGFIYSVSGVSCDEGNHAGLGECIYFSAVTWATLGYGDYEPDMGVSKVIAAIESIMGYCFMGLLVALVAGTILENTPAILSAATYRNIEDE